MPITIFPKFDFGRGGIVETPPIPSGTPFTLTEDGIWTWFTDHRAIERQNGNLLVMVVTKNGTCFLHERDKTTGIVSSVQLSSTGLEIDDHDNGSIYERTDGRLVAFYGTHNDSVFRYKVSNTPSILGGWSSEQQRGTSQGSYSYPYVFQFQQDMSKFWYFNRRWFDGSGSTRSLSFRTTTSLIGSSDPWSTYTDVWRVSGKIPYWRLMSDNVNKLHVAATDMHPVQGQSSLYHFYIRLDGSNTPRYYNSNNIEITTLPVPTSSATLIHDGTLQKCWVSDLIIGSDGQPHCLYMVYPNNNGSVIEYWYARWNGSAWLKSKITNDGSGLYSGEPYYHGGLCFDSLNQRVVYLSAPILGVRQIQKWETADNGASWSASNIITSGGTTDAPLKLRPYSPYVKSGVRQSPPLLWCEGRYTSYTDYDTKINGIT